MNIFYKKLGKNFSKDELKKLFDSSLPGKTLEQCQTLIEKSTIIGAFDENTLIGIGRSLDDGVYAFITDILVDANYRDKGIGTEIVKYVCQDLCTRGIKIIHCSTSKNLIDFYKKSDFEYDENDITMYLKNFST